MLIKKSDSRKVKNSSRCTVWEYDFANEHFSCATAHINGRYPEEKSAVNTECEQLYYVISGSGTIHSEEGDFSITEGDAYFFEKGELYWVEGKELAIVIVNTPKWRIDQYKNI